MFKYRVIGKRKNGNAKNIYTVKDLETNDVFECFLPFISSKTDEDFINVSIRYGYEGRKNVNILRHDKKETQNNKLYLELL